MAFPTNPTNGETANVNGIVYTYSSALTAWQVTVAFSGNVTVDQLNADVVSSVTFVGDGSQLTGIDASKISNGTSNVAVVSSGNVTTTIDGNVVTVVSAGGLQSQFITSPRTISANTTVGANVNAMSAGPITIADGVTVTVASGGEWSVV